MSRQVDVYEATGNNLKGYYRIGRAQGLSPAIRAAIYQASNMSLPSINVALSSKRNPSLIRSIVGAALCACPIGFCYNLFI